MYFKQLVTNMEDVFAFAEEIIDTNIMAEDPREDTDAFIKNFFMENQRKKRDFAAIFHA